MMKRSCVEVEVEIRFIFTLEWSGTLALPSIGSVEFSELAFWL